MAEYVLGLASLFALALATSIIPGPTNFLLMRISMRQGRWPGVMAAFGTTLSCMIWCLAAVVGLAALFKAAPWLYGAMRIAGGLYLLWCAWSLWRAQPAAPAIASSDATRQAFWTGFAVNMTNPKSVLFFASIFSAYVGPATPFWVQGAAVAVVCFVCLGWCAGMAWLFSTSAAIDAYARMQALLDRVAAVLMAAFGLGLLWTSASGGLKEPPMPMSQPDLEAALREGFPDAEILVTDLAGDGDHYRAKIVSTQFKGLPRVRQHQLVYAALKGKMGGELHALALETSAPA